jgi:hypothetical protein
MRFFVPQSKKAQQLSDYQAIIALLKDQLRWPIEDRKIYSLSYTHDKKDYSVEVGKLEPLEGRYTVLAILDSSVYLVFTKAKDGRPGTTILVNKTEVTQVVEFE